MPNRMIRLVTTSIVAFAASAATLAQQFDTRKRGKSTRSTRITASLSPI